MLSKIKQIKYKEYLTKLPKLFQSVNDIKIIYKSKDFKKNILNQISKAQNIIYITALYLENDDAGKDIMHALYAAKQANESLDIKIFVDWHRAQRGYIGDNIDITNADWYYQLSNLYPKINIFIFGVPINTREALGVLHLKGFIFDDILIYSGASISNIYLYNDKKYRYDRYFLIKNSELTIIMKQFIDETLLQSKAIQLFNTLSLPKTVDFKRLIKQFRINLKNSSYHFIGNANNDVLSVSPFVGLGKKSKLNRVIINLIGSTTDKLIMCTPYFNLPAVFVRIINKLLYNGKKIEIIVGDKTANDFYSSPEKKFKIISILPYLYEINLKYFMRSFQYFIDSNQLVIRIWRDGNNTYHLKGIWVDNCWQLITGNNLNPRALRLDLENAILIHDPKEELVNQRRNELNYIRTYTKVIKHYTELENIHEYPIKIKKLIRRIRRIHVDKIINQIL
ncbi:CDP-diacylglycerol--serine O-phosphatidyltransferase [Candidatus Providencia siddallii]|uniref:CDP-diacylglycerol--serine O-phosphatidyltransferase n=1 Tax=Candidatus Providencia siddallii TaxID=1715285 RepID=A0A0M6W7I9_9GAMM|nr:CDP-diacylglycerol--serine O-phosphatidyltransferase [Candidatus Providencia siddallii]